VRLASGKELGPKGLQVVPAGDRVIVSMPGGGGMGEPAERDTEAVRRDVRLGYVTEAAARRDYGADI
jgi:N-methylhydantoinase B